MPFNCQRLFSIREKIAPRNKCGQIQNGQDNKNPHKGKDQIFKRLYPSIF